jgi:hypothetical protein
MSTQPLFRIHRDGREPWWFSSDGLGRFDLVAPNGTCYLAEDPLGAFVEVFRTTAAIPEVEIAARGLSTLHVPRSLVLADCTARRARAFGITAAVHSTQDYQQTQPWAEAFARAGFAGVRYLLSHDPAQRLAGIALFGPAGSAQWALASTRAINQQVLLSVRRSFSIRVVPVR